MSHNSIRRSIPLPVKLAMPLAVLGLTAAACSSSGGSSGSSSVAAGGNASSPAAGSSASSPATASGAVVTTHSGSMGTYLTDGSGRALYLWVADPKDKSNCSGACASVWPPFTTNATPTAAGSAKAAELGTITRSDGTKQVTYAGHALYYYAPDTAAGQTTGEGNPGFGAKWWLVAPSGASITVGGASTHSSGSSSSSGSTGGSGGGWA